ncbi:MAG: hypothetical protein K6G00_00765 [Treponema sp.]|nr:hypothetical protein [Treponema sp.]
MLVQAVTFSSGTVTLTVSDSDLTITNGSLTASGSGKTKGNLIAHVKFESRNFTRKEEIQNVHGHWSESKLLPPGEELWIYSNKTAIWKGPMTQNVQVGPINEGKQLVIADFTNQNLNAPGAKFTFFMVEFTGNGGKLTLAKDVTSLGNGTMTATHSPERPMKGKDGKYYSVDYTETWKILN